MIVCQSKHCKACYNEHPKGFFNFCHVELNLLSFGFATSTKIRILIGYDVNYAKFNLEKPEVPIYYSTPRLLLKKEMLDEEPIPAPKMRPGYTSKLMQEFEDKNFPDGFHRVQWDYPVRNMKAGIKYVHPDGERLLTKTEIAFLYGAGFEHIHFDVVQYLQKQLSFYEAKAWGDLDFAARYEKFRDKWFINNFLNTPTIKSYDFSQLCPPFCHPISDIYPKKALAR